jgi:hypothetical protein
LRKGKIGREGKIGKNKQKMSGLTRLGNSGGDKTSNLKEGRERWGMVTFWGVLGEERFCGDL